MARIFIVEDDYLMGECIARAVAPLGESAIFADAITAMAAMSEAPAAGENVGAPAAAEAVGPAAATEAPAAGALPVQPATEAPAAGALPALIFLDVLLSGPSGFTLLNELASYSDTATIPVVLVTSLNLAGHDLSHYGVRAVLDKATMTPQDIYRTAREVLPPAQVAQRAAHGVAPAQTVRHATSKALPPALACSELDHA